jgi:hypothetical protein
MRKGKLKRRRERERERSKRAEQGTWNFEREGARENGFEPKTFVTGSRYRYKVPDCTVWSPKRIFSFRCYKCHTNKVVV